MKARAVVAAAVLGAATLVPSLTASATPVAPWRLVDGADCWEGSYGLHIGADRGVLAAQLQEESGVCGPHAIFQLWFDPQVDRWAMHMTVANAWVSVGVGNALIAWNTNPTPGPSSLFQLGCSVRDHTEIPLWDSTGQDTWVGTNTWHAEAAAWGPTYLLEEIVAASDHLCNPLNP